MLSHSLRSQCCQQTILLSEMHTSRWMTMDLMHHLCCVKSSRQKAWTRSCLSQELIEIKAHLNLKVELELKLQWMTCTQMCKTWLPRESCSNYWVSSSQSCSTTRTPWRPSTVTSLKLWVTCWSSKAQTLWTSSARSTSILKIQIKFKLHSTSRF